MHDPVQDAAEGVLRNVQESHARLGLGRPIDMVGTDRHPKLRPETAIAALSLACTRVVLLLSGPCLGVDSLAWAIYEQRVRPVHQRGV